MSFPISAPPLEPQIRGHFYWALKGTLSLGYNTLAQCAGSMPRFAALGRSRADAALCADAARRVVCRGAADDAHGLAERDLAALRIRDAIGSRGPMSAAGSNRRIRLTRMSGGVGGCRGAIPVTRPDRQKGQTREPRLPLGPRPIHRFVGQPGGRNRGLLAADDSSWTRCLGERTDAG